MASLYDESAWQIIEARTEISGKPTQIPEKRRHLWHAAWYAEKWQIDHREAAHPARVAPARLDHAGGRRVCRARVAAAPVRALPISFAIAKPTNRPRGQIRSAHPSWPNPHSARGTGVAHLPRVPSLKVFGRRPSACGNVRTGRHPKPCTGRRSRCNHTPSAHSPARDIVRRADPLRQLFLRSRRPLIRTPPAEAGH
jgi:hypothetical protein